MLPASYMQGDRILHSWSICITILDTRVLEWSSLEVAGFHIAVFGLIDVTCHMSHYSRSRAVVGLLTAPARTVRYSTFV